jgi:hypothetical protein
VLGTIEATNRVTLFSPRGLIMAVVRSRESVELPTAEVEAARRELSGDAATLQAPEAESEVVANSIGSLLQRVAGSSVQEIDQLVAELQTIRTLLESEGARVQREIIEYAHLSQSAMQTTKVIAENLARRTFTPTAIN